MRFQGAPGGSVQEFAVYEFGNGDLVGAIEVVDSNAVIVSGNFVGVAPNATGDTTGGNDAYGIRLIRSARTAVNNNVIGYNSVAGLDVTVSSTDTTVDGNFIGITGDDEPIPNGHGIVVYGSDRTVIGGVEGNTIAFNSGHPIQLIAESLETEIYNNSLGVTSSNSAPTGPIQPFTGIMVRDMSTATIGDAGRGNTIGSLAADGIRIDDATATIKGNYIGTNSTNADLGNAGRGIHVTDPGSNAITVAGTSQNTTIENNVIAYNGTDGITVLQGFARISENSIFNNGGLAIDLGDDGVNLNDVGDGDDGPNGLLNFPVIQEIRQINDTQFEVPVEIDVPAGQYRVEFYENSISDPSGFGEAETFVDAVQAQSTGVPIEVTLPASDLTAGSYLSVLLYNEVTGATSELSNTVLVPNLDPALTNPGNQTGSENSPTTLPVIAVDPDNDQLTYTASGLPPGLSINSTNGTISGTPTFDAAANSPYTVTVSVADDGTPQREDEVTFLWTITDSNRAPGLQAIAPQTTDEGTPVNLSVTGSDPDGDSLNYTASGLPPGLSINVTTGEITGSPTIPGTYVVNITATDGTTTTTTQFSWNIVGQPTPSTTTAPTTTIAPTTTTTPSTCLLYTSPSPRDRG